MAKYIKQEMKDLNGSGQHRVFYRIKRRAHISTAQLAQKLARGGSGLSEGDVYHVLLSLGEELAVQLAEGNSVTLEGIGTFFASIGVVDGKVAGSLELQRWREDASSGITTSGKGKHIVYVLR